MGIWEVPDYSAIAGVRPVRRLQDWAALSGVEFRQRFSNQPVVLEGVARAWPAFRKWTREYLAEKCGTDLVTVRTPGMLGSEEVQLSARVPLRSFAEGVASSPGAYLAQWYAYRRHPELYDDIGWLPEYLSIDWLAGVPRGWVMSTFDRNNIYWGAAGSSTYCHYDHLNAVTWNATISGTKRWLLFSGRMFPEVEQSRCLARLVRTGLATSGPSALSEGLVTPAGIRRYLDGRLEGLPPDITFQWADVVDGDLIYVPWRWFHQVHNVTESLAVSRYYVAEENYAAAVAFLRERGWLRALAFRGLAGSSTMRRLLSTPSVQHALSARWICTAVRGVLRGAGHAA